MAVSRRKFVGGLAAGVGYLGMRPDIPLFAAAPAAAPDAADLSDAVRKAQAEYDGFAKLSNNENPYGPPESVMKAMTNAFKYANRYGYPDGGIVQAIAEYHGVKPENVLLGEGSSEILDISDATFLQGGRKVIGAEPTYATIFQYAAGTKSEGIHVPLLPDYRQDIPAMILAAKHNYRDVGLVYICNPNNPTGVVVPKQEIKQLLDELPQDIPVLIDEAYHHFVEDPDYETSTRHVLEGRPVILTRTFSKIVGLAGMRLGYAVAPKYLIDRMRVYSINYGINAIVKYGGVAALKDTASQAKVKQLNTEIRNRTTSELQTLGYEVIPSQTNFFMVNVGRDVVEVAKEFKKRGVLVGRPFPPMMKYLRVSVGSADEMSRFMTAFKEIFPAKSSTSARVG
ncbi:MAG: pyridoxal phosphate-dependent aminotransferase [Betaproteobacteria bacterium]